jgi:hypothetical protein
MRVLYLFLRNIKKFLFEKNDELWCDRSGGDNVSRASKHFFAFCFIEIFKCLGPELASLIDERNILEVRFREIILLIQIVSYPRIEQSDDIPRIESESFLETCGGI